MNSTEYKYLNRIDSPEELKKLTVDELQPYCDELRDFIVRNLSQNPGHLASNLGSVEFTTALHYVYDTPSDKVVWDVGHQAYAHKIITGRRDLFHTNRKKDGLSGFPRRAESPYDAFGAGHSSTSISAALGIAVAEKIKGGSAKTIAVIGDGAMSGGLAFEGINNAGAQDADLLVILNDNKMSISPNVGALKEILLNITTSHGYNKIKGRTWNRLAGMPRLRHLLQKINHLLKNSLLHQSNLFESFHLRYFGPVDGHDVKTLVKVLRDLKNLPGPKLLHIMTIKGKGYAPAENGNPEEWHSPGRFDYATGKREKSHQSATLKFQYVFGRTLLELARKDERVVGVTPAMLTGSSMNILQQAMPERCFDVGIAEGHAVTFSAGLATDGMRPFCNIYSSFMQRAYDNVIHDVALQNLPVVMCLDRAGLVGEDGATHNGEFDLAYFRCIPNLTIAAPMNGNELRNMMHTALTLDGPMVIRYPRGFEEGEIDEQASTMPIGKGRLLKEGGDIAVLSIGATGNSALRAALRLEEEGVWAAVYDMRWAKPLDEEILLHVGERYNEVVTVEDGVTDGGVGSAVAEYMSERGLRCRVTRLGIGDEFVEHATVAEQKAACGYDEEGIVCTIRRVLGR